ncbi:helix-turn-helix transcriptional regulator [Mycolicibacterium sp. 120266]|uniref:helix-turn-helix domain-containing protein n=1 Tax=Mycolicibacterium sp. 120266 TaxID=3090601 RepID=UPI00299EAE08|nr:helix-turn-helix transcriptional regulator [Mycolicibacterium sp. 120266]MDX1873259.1 helix-turn-helix transcriptional regulator [Mycolicibacterium sp. 120266]
MTIKSDSTTGENQLVARNVRRFRRERGMSLGELARRSGLAKQTLSKIEKGTGNPTVETLALLGAALDLPARRLLTEWGTPVYIQRRDQAVWSGGPNGRNDYSTRFTARVTCAHFGCAWSAAASSPHRLNRTHRALFITCSWLPGGCAPVRSVNRSTWRRGTSSDSQATWRTALFASVIERLRTW